MENTKKVKKDNKNIIVIGAVIILIIVAIVSARVISTKIEESKTVTATLGETQWMEKGQELTFTDGDNVVTFTISTEDDLVKTDGDYEYTISYVLNVNGTEYTGTHRFGNGYSVHNEDNNIPYKIDITDFENNSIEVSFTANQGE